MNGACHTYEQAISHYEQVMNASWRPIPHMQVAREQQAEEAPVDQEVDEEEAEDDMAEGEEKAEVNEGEIGAPLLNLRQQIRLHTKMLHVKNLISPPPFPFLPFFLYFPSSCPPLPISPPRRSVDCYWKLRNITIIESTKWGSLLDIL